MFALYEYFEQEKIKIAYFGKLTENITTMLIELTDSYVSNENQFSKLSGTISFFISECFKNISFEENSQKESFTQITDSKDFFQINILDDRIVVSLANIVEQQDVEILESQINSLNTLDINELEKLHRKSSATAKIGTNSGLMEMTGKSGIQIQKQFTVLDNKHSRLFLCFEIPTDKDFSPQKNIISKIEQNYKLLTDQNAMIFYKGDFSSESNSNLAEILHDNFIAENNITSGNIKNMITVIEVIQNVSKHGKSINGHKTGFFSLREIDEDLFIECSNYINPENFETFNNYIETLKSCSTEEVQKLYKNKLFNSEMSDQGNSGIGLLEIALFTRNKFSYRFTQTADKEIFYTIKIKTE